MTPRRALAGLLLWGGLLSLALTSVLAGAARARQRDPRAAQLYQANCAFCHGVQGQGTFRGPRLIGVGEASVDYYLRSGRMPVTAPGPAPPRQQPKLSEPQIESLVTYVGGLGSGLASAGAASAGPPIPEVELRGADLSRGQQLYQLNCAACHNWDGKGGAMVSSDYPLAYPLRAVPPLQVAEAVRIGPGTMPVFPPSVLSDDEVDDIVAYVQYLKHPLDAGGYGLAHWGPATEGLAATAGLALILLITGWLGQRSGAPEPGAPAPIREGSRPDDRGESAHAGEGGQR